MSSINYDLKKIKAFVFDVDGVLSPNTVPIDSDGMPARMANVKDGYAMQLAVKRGYKIAIISGASSELVRTRFNLLGINDVYLGASRKLEILKGWMNSHGLQPERVAYVGDDLPDLECMHHVGLPVAPADASTDALDAAIFISRRSGGHGVARDLIEQVMRAQSLWNHDSTALSW